MTELEEGKELRWAIARIWAAIKHDRPDRAKTIAEEAIGQNYSLMALAQEELSERWADGGSFDPATPTEELPCLKEWFYDLYSMTDGNSAREWISNRVWDSKAGSIEEASGLLNSRIESTVLWLRKFKRPPIRGGTPATEKHKGQIENWGLRNGRTAAVNPAAWVFEQHDILVGIVEDGGKSAIAVSLSGEYLCPEMLSKEGSAVPLVYRMAIALEQRGYTVVLDEEGALLIEALTGGANGSDSKVSE